MAAIRASSHLLRPWSHGDRAGPAGATRVDQVSFVCLHILGTDLSLQIPLKNELKFKEVLLKLKDMGWTIYLPKGARQLRTTLCAETPPCPRHCPLGSALYGDASFLQRTECLNSPEVCILRDFLHFMGRKS